jgi:ribosomal protein S18 acetylase RimI-like enzyme
MLNKPASDLSNQALGNLCLAVYNRSTAHNLAFKPDDFPRWCADNSVSLQRSLAFYVEEHPNNPVGLVLVAPAETETTTSKIVLFGVVPCFRSQGIGRDALQDVVKSERERGVEVLHVQVFAENEQAVGRFKKEGFAVEKEVAEEGARQYRMSRRL